jgi:hypothetical protein
MKVARSAWCVVRGQKAKASTKRIGARFDSKFGRSVPAFTKSDYWVPESGTLSPNYDWTGSQRPNLPMQRTGFGRASISRAVLPSLILRPRQDDGT